MKAEKHYFILAVVVGVLCVSALGEVEPSRLEGGLIGQPNPTLAEIDKLYVWIVPHGFEPNSPGPVFEELENLIIDRLKEASITIAKTDIDKAGPNAAKMLKILERRIESANVKNLKFRSARIPELRVDIDTLVLKHLQQAVFHIQISLARLVHLEKENRLTFKTDVWQSKPVMQAVSVEDMPDKVTDVVLEQVEAFITAYLAANPKGVQPTVRSTQTEYQYVASKNSKVFHRPQCSSVKRISPKNLVGYSSRDEAIKAGKRPCKLCKP